MVAGDGFEVRVVRQYGHQLALNRIYIVNHPVITDVEGRIRLIARGDKRTAQEFSLAFLKECVARDGDVTAFLGVSL